LPARSLPWIVWLAWQGRFNALLTRVRVVAAQSFAF
jgi:hypothetical protein